jgi:hypothetical protein
MGLPYCGMPGDTLNVKIIRIADSRLWFYVWISHTRLEVENFGSRKVMRFTRAAEQNNLRDWESDLWNGTLYCYELPWKGSKLASIDMR